MRRLKGFGVRRISGVVEVWWWWREERERDKEEAIVFGFVLSGDETLERKREERNVFVFCLCLLLLLLVGWFVVSLLWVLSSI